MSEAARQGLVICVSGPSGVGKGTIIREVIAQRPQIAHSVSMTTRPPRRGERDGIDYHFSDRATFQHMLENAEILEYDLYCDHYYGTPRRPLEQTIATGRDMIMDITVPGSLAVMNAFPECITVFLLPPSLTVLEQRLIRRGTETEENLRRRLQKAREEIGMADHFQYVVVNDDLQETAQRILHIIDSEHCRYHRIAGIEQTILAR
ncbi:MAG: guanylate kinase [Ruminococcaceae bacterium]|jgi:guanylate kinase|nr:guanylate kinase [Oscillospiraceae bacterium]